MLETRSQDAAKIPAMSDPVRSRRGLRAGAGVFVALALVAVASGWAGCSYSNPHGEQDTPPVLRLTTVPAGAKVVIEDMNLELETPCDLPTELDPDDEISVTREGYRPFKGTLADLREIARGTYQLRLDPLPPPGD